MSNGNHSALRRQLTNSKRDRLDIFRRISQTEQGLALLELSTYVQKQIIGRLSDDELVEILNYLDLQQTTKLLRRTDKKRADSILDRLSDNVREKVEYLLRFNPRAAAGMMSVNYISVPEDAKFKDVYDALAGLERATGKFPTILVMDNGNLHGELPGHEMVLAKANEYILPKIKKVPTLAYDTPEKQVVHSFLDNPHTKIVVVDEHKAVLGIINTDDIIPLLQKNAPGGLYKFAGVSHEEDSLDSAMTKVRFRYKWLIINLATAFLAASVVGLFEDTISKYALLAVYMPIVAGMGGNAGTQTLAVAVRGLVMKEIELGNGSARMIQREMIAGAINGLINGLIVAAIVITFNHNPVLALVLGVAMVVNLTIAGLFGAFVPMLMKKLGKDPASSATIFITTATDVFGFFVFLGLATMLLK